MNLRRTPLIYSNFNSIHFFKFYLTLLLFAFSISCSNLINKTIQSKREIPELCFGIRDKRVKLEVTPYTITPVNLKKLRSHFSDNAISVANDIGVTEYLLEFLSLGGKNKATNRKLFIMKEVQERISLSQMELSSMIAIADCERDRSMQLASHLDILTNKEMNRLAVRSLLSTVTGTSLAAILELTGNTNQLYLAADVAFALLAGYFAYQSVNIETKGYLGHSHNLLRELKDKPSKPELFYSTVWNFLNNENYPNEPSERNEILHLWSKYEVTAEDEKLFYSDGGKYSSPQLYKLVLKYDTLKTRMAYMQIELRQLQEELENKEHEFL